MILSLLPAEPAFQERIFTEIQETDFTDEDMRRLFQEMSSLYHQGLELTWPKILSFVPEDSFREELMGPSLFESSHEEKQKALEDCFQKMRSRRKQQKMENLRRLIAQAEREGNQNQVHVYVSEYQNLLKASQP